VAEATGKVPVPINCSGIPDAAADQFDHLADVRSDVN
jgi:hypothetical protein